MLKRHQASIDLSQNALVIQGRKIRFLPEHEIPKTLEEMDEAELLYEKILQLCIANIIFNRNLILANHLTVQTRTPAKPLQDRRTDRPGDFRGQVIFYY